MNTEIEKLQSLELKIKELQASIDNPSLSINWVIKHILNQTNE